MSDESHLHSNFAHLHLHTEYSELDGGCKVAKIAAKAKSLGMRHVGISDHGNVNGLPAFAQAMKGEGIKPVLGCLPAGHLIETPLGPIPIEDIKPGDEVFTHEGRVRRVTGTMQRPHKGTIYGLRVGKGKQKITWVTGEHPVLIRRRGADDVDWVRADALVAGRPGAKPGVDNWNSYAVVPRMRPEKIIRKIEVAPHLGDRYRVRKGRIERLAGCKWEPDAVPMNFPLAVPVTHQFARMLGLFVAEGSFDKNGVGVTACRWTFGPSEMAYAKEIVQAARDIFGLSASIYDRSETPKHIIEVHVSSVILARFMESLCGRGALNKRVPDVVYSFSDECAMAFLSGLTDGDGSLKPSGQMILKVGSRSLAYGARRLVSRFGVYSSIHERCDDGRSSYTVAWKADAAFRHHHVDDRFIYLPLKDVEVAHFEGDVYNFEVEDDHSYVSEIVLHNCEIYLTPDRTIKKREAKTWHLGLIAANKEGYKNLTQITTRAWLEGYFNRRGRADWDVLADHAGGIIALTGCMAAPVMNALFEGSYTDAREHTKRLIEIFGKDNVYGEVQNVGIVEPIPADSELALKLGKAELSQMDANLQLAEICKEFGIPLIATGDVHYLEESDALPHDAMVCLGTGQIQARPETRKFSLLPKKYYFRTEEEMRENLPGFGEAIEETVRLAERVEDDIIEFDQDLLPSFPIPEGFADSKEYLRHLCEEGMVQRYGPREEQTEEQRERLDFELGVIDSMGFNDYFLITGDFFRESFERNIPTGPGRGSAAGSIVAYLLGITQLDPLKYGLLFERFLNPGRKSMPDIDCDFSRYRREEIIDYVRQKYNDLAGTTTAVSQILTHGTIGAKAGLRDAARVLDKPIALGDRLSKMVPDKPGTSLRDAYEQVPEFKTAFKVDPDAREVIKLAGWLEGFVRQSGIHAAGVVILDRPLETVVPLQRRGDKEPLTTAYEQKWVEKIGLLKMDFLGLKTLDLIWRALEIVKHTTGKDLGNPYTDIPLDDAKTYEMLARGEAIGVFQFESSGMRESLRLIQPTEFRDLIALVALYRPGPLEYIPVYAARKQGKESVSFPDERLEPILAETYGITVYQEQSMQIARALADFSPAEADDLRKAIGKKMRDLMDSMRPKFIEGCVKNSVPKPVAEQLWADNEKAADYSFNKSHAACYGFLAYVTAYLKANYPAAYMAALMSINADTKDKVPVFINEAKRMGLTVRPPDVNRSLRDFAVMESEDEGREGEFEILFGLSAVKGVGDAVISDIRTEREAHGPFRSVTDLIRRMPQLNKGVIERLVKSGALDGTGQTRKGMFDAIEALIDVNRKEARAKEKAFVTEVLGVYGTASALDPNAAPEPSSAAPAPSAAPADEGQVLFDFGAPAEEEKPAKKGAKPKAAKLPTEEKKAVEAIAKAANTARAVPSVADARAAALKAITSEEQRKLRAEARKQTEIDSDQLEAGVQRTLAEGEDRRKAEAKAITKKTLQCVEEVMGRVPDEQEEVLAALAEQAPTVPIGTEEWEEMEKLNLEREILGLYVSAHPLTRHEKQWRRYASHGIGALSGKDLDTSVRVVGAVTGTRLLRTKKGEQFGIEVMLDDPTGSRPVTFFTPRAGEAARPPRPGGDRPGFKTRVTIDSETQALLQDGTIIVVNAKVVEDAFRGAQKQEEEADPDAIQDESQIEVKLEGLAVYTWKPDQVDTSPVSPFEIHIPPAARTKQVLMQLEETLEASPGPSPVIICIDDKRVKLKRDGGAGSQYRVAITPTLQKEVSRLLGTGA